MSNPFAELERTGDAASEEEAAGALELVHHLAPILKEAALKALARSGYK